MRWCFAARIMSHMRRDTMCHCPTAHPMHLEPVRWLMWWASAAEESVTLLVANFTPAGKSVWADEVQTFEIFDFFKPVAPQRALVSGLNKIFTHRLKGAMRVGVELGRLPVLVLPRADCAQCA